MFRNPPEVEVALETLVVRAEDDEMDELAVEELAEVVEIDEDETEVVREQQ